MRKFFKSALLALFFMSLVPMMTLAQKAMQFEKQPLSIVQQNGKKIDLEVEVAKSIQQRAQGLMFRTEMAENAGMIFDFGEPQRVQMWMENTVLPLDMLFIDQAGIVRHVKERAVPYSRAIIDSTLPVTYVLELNAGAVKRWNLRVGDKVVGKSIRSR